MMRAAAISASMLLANSAAFAGGFVDSFIALHFVGPDGVTHEVEYALGLPKLASGLPDCAGNLDGMLPPFVKDARRKLQDGEKMTLKGVTCRPVGKDWVKIVQRVPVRNAAANED